MPHPNPRKEAAYEARPIQKKRRAARNRARRAAMRKGLVRKGDGKELDHVGYHRSGSLKNVRTVVVSRAVNRSRQPDRPGGRSARANYAKQRKRTRALKTRKY